MAWNALGSREVIPTLKELLGFICYNILCCSSKCIYTGHSSLRKCYFLGGTWRCNTIQSAYWGKEKETPITGKQVNATSWIKCFLALANKDSLQCGLSRDRENSLGSLLLLIASTNGKIPVALIQWQFFCVSNVLTLYQWINTSHLLCFSFSRGTMFVPSLRDSILGFKSLEVIISENSANINWIPTMCKALHYMFQKAQNWVICILFSKTLIIQ